MEEGDVMCSCVVVVCSSCGIRGISEIRTWWRIDMEVGRQVEY